MKTLADIKEKTADELTLTKEQYKNKKHREMAKELHPDMSTGDTEQFKKLNIAHKILKRELT